MVIVPTNKYQTQITSELKEELDEEVYLRVLEFIESVPWVKALIAPNRPFAGDIENRKDGKIKIDFTNPHILEDMDFFIQARLTYLETGKFTHAPFSRDPHSPYMKFWLEEERRCLDGMVREEDGEWISGYNYFYWNYGWIELTEKVGETTDRGLTRAKRVDTFPDIWEIDYFFFHYIEQAEEQGLFGVLLKSRGKGASYKGANMGLRNMYIIKNSNSYYLAYYDGYLYDDGTMNKLQFNMKLMEDTAFAKRKLSDTLEFVQLGYKNKNKNNTEEGYLSFAMGVNIKNPNKARGKRGKLLVYEEAGSNPGLIKAWTISEESINQAGDVYGFQLAMGTGGDENSDFRGLTELFNKPSGYSILGIPNVFDKNASHRNGGFFIGYYMNTSGNYDENGTTNVVESLISIFIKRVNLERTIDDKEHLAQKFAETAMTPLEAVTVMSDVTFPVTQIKAKILEFTSNIGHNTAHHHHVDLQRVGLDVSMVHGTTVPITSYPYKGRNAARASLTLTTLPATHSNGTPEWGRYIMGLDTLDDDGGVGSLFSFQIMDLWTDEIIGWYIGRKIMVEDDYELALTTAIYFNAVINYESNFKGFYGFCKNKNALNYLCDTPAILKDKGMGAKREQVGNQLKGTRANAQVNNYGRRLQNTWLRKPHMSQQGKTGLDTLEDVEYMTELSLWEAIGNYDKVSSGNMLFILREDRQQVLSHAQGMGEDPTEDYNSETFIVRNGTSAEFGQGNFNLNSDEYDDD